MKIENSIGWCDETGNKVTGCDKVSPGCKNCYAQVGTRARVLRASGIETWGPKGQRYPVADFSKKVRRLNKLCVCDTCHTAADVQYLDPKYSCHHCLNSAGKFSKFRRIRIFADSNSDWLDDKWPIGTLADLLKDIHDCPNVDFLLLTKRIENFEDRLLECQGEFKDGSSELALVVKWCHGGAPENVWIGVSVEDQKRADERIPLLLQIPAKVRFLSVEPLLEQVDIPKVLKSSIGYNSDGSDKVWSLPNRPLLNWVIVGGESGAERRDCGVEAICDVARQCVAAGVPCFVKQDCAFKSGQQGRIPEGVWTLKEFPA